MVDHPVEIPQLPSERAIGAGRDACRPRASRRERPGSSDGRTGPRARTSRSATGASCGSPPQGVAQDARERRQRGVPRERVHQQLLRQHVMRGHVVVLARSTSAAAIASWCRIMWVAGAVARLRRGVFRVGTLSREQDAPPSRKRLRSACQRPCLTSSRSEALRMGSADPLRQTSRPCCGAVLEALCRTRTRRPLPYHGSLAGSSGVAPEAKAPAQMRIRHSTGVRRSPRRSAASVTRSVPGQAERQRTPRPVLIRVSMEFNEPNVEYGYSYASVRMGAAPRDRCRRSRARPAGPLRHVGAGPVPPPSRRASSPRRSARCWAGGCMRWRVARRT
jgi:hypothetical protein